MTLGSILAKFASNTWPAKLSQKRLGSRQLLKFLLQLQCFVKLSQWGGFSLVPWDQETRLYSSGNLSAQSIWRSKGLTLDHSSVSKVPMCLEVFFYCGKMNDLQLLYNPINNYQLYYWQSNHKFAIQSIITEKYNTKIKKLHSTQFCMYAMQMLKYICRNYIKKSSFDMTTLRDETHLALPTREKTCTSHKNHHSWAGQS